MRLILLWLAALLLGGAAPATEPDIVLTGTLTRADHESYRELPFTVPAGIEAVSVDFDYTGREERTTVDLGLRDPRRFRGWSGGNKRRFTLSETEATPSYLPGPIVPGRWSLILGIPNIREGTTASYRAEIRFRRTGEPFTGFTDTPLAMGPRWFRGDLHAHSAHSDGSCTAQSGARVPCPVHRTVEAAAARNLDFVALTEHNATSHHAAMRELQPLFDRLLLIPGREITTFQGHLNVYGVLAPLDFQVGSPRAPTMNHVLARAQESGGLVSVNHPVAPSGEACMGCGWTPPETDWSQVDAIEVVNGGAIAALGAVESPISGIPFWHARLNEGHRLTGIAGSDNHDATLDPSDPPAIGRPTTVVHARELSQPALLAGIRAGRTFIDVEGTPDRLLEMEVKLGGASSLMGGALQARRGEATASVRVAGVPEGRVELIAQGQVVARAPLAGDGLVTLRIPLDGKRRWLRADVRDRAGKLLLIGNPVYLVEP